MSVPQGLCRELFHVFHVDRRGGSGPDELEFLTDNYAIQKQSGASQNWPFGISGLDLKLFCKGFFFLHLKFSATVQGLWARESESVVLLRKQNRSLASSAGLAATFVFCKANFRVRFLCCLRCLSRSIFGSWVGSLSRTKHFFATSRKSDIPPENIRHRLHYNLRGPSSLYEFLRTDLQLLFGARLGGEFSALAKPWAVIRQLVLSRWKDGETNNIY